MVTNEIHFYDGLNLGGGIINKLRLKHVNNFSLSPSSLPYRVAAFVPMKADAPASIRVWDYPKLEEGDMKALKSFFKAEVGRAQLAPRSVRRSRTSRRGHTGVHHALE